METTLAVVLAVAMLSLALAFALLLSRDTRRGSARLLEAWEQALVQGIGAELGSDLLGALGQFPAAAATIVRHDAECEDFHRRRAAATLAGYILAGNDNSLLADLLAGERERDRFLPRDSPQRLECQSVVEAIVFAGIRWSRAKRAGGLEVLKIVVQATSSRLEYWNSSSFAITELALSRGHVPDFEALFSEFDTFARSESPPSHPTNPTLRQERRYCDGILSGDQRILASVSPRRVGRATADPPSQQRGCGDLLEAAERYEGTASGRAGLQ